MKREPTFLAFLPLCVQGAPSTQMEVADNSGTSPSLFLPHSLPKLSQRAKIWKWSFSFSCYIVYLVLCASQVCWEREGYPSIYTRARRCLGACHRQSEARTWIPTPWCFARFALSWWASPLFLCANQHQKAPFGELFHVFVFVTYKTNVLQIHVELG